MRDVFIVECVRTPLGRGKKNGALHNVLPVQLLATTLEEVVDRVGLGKEYVEDVVCGCVTPLNQQGGNIGRLAALQAGYPVEVPGVQINRMCGSGQQAIHFIGQAIAAGDIDVGVACGVEMMSVVKMGSDFASEFMRAEFRDNFPFQLVHQGQSAEILAERYGVSRAECDDFASESHDRCGRARDAGYFDSQIVPITVKQADGSSKVVSTDEGIRYPANRASLDKLRSVFKKDGVVTAGNASQITDGASAVLLCSGTALARFGLKPRARILSRVVVGSDPIRMLDGVIPATRKALAKAGKRLEDIDVFEINEAFASVVLSWKKVLGVDMNKANPNGGACAHGHPLGATGCVLMTKLVNELERRNARYGLQTMCIGWGMATASVIERVDGTTFGTSRL